MYNKCPEEIRLNLIAITLKANKNGFKISRCTPQHYFISPNALLIAHYK